MTGLSFVTEELIDQIQDITGLETEEQAIQYALTHTILTTHLCDTRRSESSFL